MSKQCDDVYYFQHNGLAESRHVFLQGNDLPTRLAQLHAQQYFCVGEIGFASALNIVALWQLWQQCRPNNHSRLHVISVGKNPLSKTDLQRSLAIWPELKPLAEQLIVQYPSALMGCHRLIFAKERFSIDVWLGDVATTLPKIDSTHSIDAWFLNGLAPKHNPALWQPRVINQIMRLSGHGTTFSALSVMSLLKHGLMQHGIDVRRTRGFGHKRDMLQATWNKTKTNVTLAAQSIKKSPTVAVIGAGIAGLSVAHALSNRGVAVTLIDQQQPLAGASGNPRALLAPQPLAIEKFSENLMNIGGLFSYRYWQQYLGVSDFSHILFFSDKKQQEQWDKIKDYPTDFLQAMTPTQASSYSQTTLSLPAIDFKQAALLNPQALCKQVLSNPLIQFKQANIQQLTQSNNQWQLMDEHSRHIVSVEHVVVCTARHSQQLCPSLPVLNAIRGQVSWAATEQAQQQLACTLSYGGYVAPIKNEQQQPVLLFGASFIKGDLSTEVKPEDHQHNYDLLASVAPDVARQLPEQQHWQGRASIRAQTNDYLPIVGKIPDMHNVWTLTALGSKGFSFAPLCAEVICAQLLNEALPISAQLAKAISPSRFIKKVRERKPYYSGPKPPIKG